MIAGLCKAETKKCFSVIPFMPNGISDPYQMDESISNLRVIWQ